ncbi:MAG TPA: twin-arginine translocase subunit TatC [Bryobacteraceae bacterium]|nr:twin-arginine translocase subunit TatC [Bryobacteraceae bacterium]
MDDEKQGGVPPSGGDAPREGNNPVIDVTPTTALVETRPAQPPALPPRPPAPPTEPEDPEEGGMLRMSFMEHLEELRGRIIKALYGLVVAFVGSLIYAGQLWDIISDPAVEALKHLKVEPPQLAQLTPMESFSIIWVKLPLLCSVFIASPWIVWQVWAFISPGLYKKERRWAMPFVLLTAGLFITGGLFAYFLAFRFGLEFLLGIGMSNNVRPVVSITEYFDLFVNVTLGVGLVFELPVLIFMLTLLRIVSPRFLIRHSRYAILIIVIAAAIITPTPDVFNLMLFAIPMCALYFVGVFFSYLLVLKREGRQFPWKKALPIILIAVVVIAGIYAAVVYFHLHFIRHWPFLTK